MVLFVASRVETAINSLAKRHFDEQQKVLGCGNGVFVTFKVDQLHVAKPTAGSEPNYLYVVGRILCAPHGDRVESRRVLVRYSNTPVRSLTEGIFFATEMVFLEAMLPALQNVLAIQDLVPAVYASEMTATTRTEVTIIHELPSGSVRWKCDSFLEFPQLLLMVDAIARFHAASFLAKATYPGLFCDGMCSPDAYSGYQRLVPLLERCLRPLQDDPRFATRSSMFSIRVRRLQLMLKNFAHFAEVTLSPSYSNDCWVLCHLKYMQTNVVFDDQSRWAKIFNWHSRGFASLGADLVILLFVEGSTLTKYQSANDLIDEYEARLKRLCGDVKTPSKEDIVNEIGLCVPIALCVLADRVDQATRDGNANAVDNVWTEKLITELFFFLVRRLYV